MRYVAYILLILFTGYHNSLCKPVQDEPVEHYPVGTMYFKWSDANRIDPYYGGNRLINVQIWYPVDFAESNNEFPASDYYHYIENAWERLEGWSKEELAFVSDIKTNSIVNAPVSSQRGNYPLLIFSPSLGGNTSLYTFYAEKLAENGFIVAGVNHLYESEFVLNEESEVIPYNLSFHDSIESLSIPEQITGDEFREQKSKRQKILAEDLIFTLGKLEEVKPEVLDGKIDFGRIGIWGHSIGGAASIYASILDERFKAVLNIDGTPPMLALESGIDVPFMFIEDLTDYENHEGYKKQFIRRNEFSKKVKADAYRVLIGGANHNSFLDINYYTAGNEDEKQKALNILNETLNYMLSFFKIYLSKEEYRIIEIESDTLEVFKF